MRHKLIVLEEDELTQTLNAIKDNGGEVSSIIIYFDASEDQFDAIADEWLEVTHD